MSGEATKVYRDSGGDRLVIAAGGQLYRATAAMATKSADYTAAATDSGKVIYVDTDAKVITLPSTAAGLCITVENAGADGAVGISVSPAAADKIMGVGLTAADNKDLINTKATAKKGDRVVLVGDGVDGWYVHELIGTWAREA